mmetsp:Transcript_11256/g.19243  ORF Transcript_11256/g.19243 Transcript_11256/m.19243 type:complete len:900 (+) Transcript_11256:96-2795(+)
MADGDEDDDHQGASSSTNPSITYTRTRKTKTAASSTRRRNNIPLCHSASGGGNASDAATGSDKSWFSRKASGWTDDEIRSHLVSGASKGGGSLSMEGDLIQGGNTSSARKKNRNERNNNKRRSGPRFAWEEEEEEEGDDYHSIMPISGREKSIMRAAPTLQDIMDEQDQIDLLAPQKLGKDYQPSGGGGGDIANDYTRPNRRTNAALAEIAQFYDNDANIGKAAPIAATESIGWRLLRVLGYRSRLGMAFIALPGSSAGKVDDQEANDLESMHLTKNLSAKHLASKGLRAIRLPSIAQNTSSNEMAKPADSHSTNQTLVIPPPKLNKHGIGFDPFKNAPEFRAFHEKRKALAKKRGRAADNSNDSRSTAYFTDNLRRDERQSLWDKKSGDNGNDDKNEMSQRSDNQQDGQHMNYAAQDYTDFIGTKASSGFALEDEDDTNVYQDDEHDGDGNNNRSGYNLEIHSPVASEDEDDDINDGLFHNSVASTRICKPSGVTKSKRNVAGAWDAWGMGEGDAVKAVTSDGKPPLQGFQLGQQKNNGNSIKRWPGPMVPSGYVLQRHTFPADDSVKATSPYAVNTPDCGLGLDLQYRSSRRPSRSSVPTILPYSEQQQQSEMRARDGTALNFDAVKESMKNRFVSSSGNGNVASKKSDSEEDRKEDEEEWINVTSTSWMPSRLLCKRWGISLPSTGATSSTNASTERTGEEAYFHETVLLKQKGDEGTRGGSIIGTKVKNREEDNYMVDAVGGDIAGPPPNRPSDDVFKSIFDAGSDMDISSSEDEEEELQDLVGESAASSNSNMRMDMDKNITSYESTQEAVAARSGSSSSESEESSHQSRKRRHRSEDRRRRKKKHRRKSPSISTDARDDSDDNSMPGEYEKKRKKKKKRHKRSHSRYKEKRKR